MSNVIDEYIAQHPTEIQPALIEIANTIRELMPENSVEKFSYQMPTFDVHGNCVHFAAFKKHIGFYPAASGIANFTDEFERRGLKYSKGAVQFPIGKPIPLDLVREMTKFRIKENIKKYELKGKK